MKGPEAGFKQMTEREVERQFDERLSRHFPIIIGIVISLALTSQYWMPSMGSFVIEWIIWLGVSVVFGFLYIMGLAILHPRG